MERTTAKTDLPNMPHPWGTARFIVATAAIASVATSEPLGSCSSSDHPSTLATLLVNRRRPTGVSMLQAKTSFAPQGALLATEPSDRPGIVERAVVVASNVPDLDEANTQGVGRTALLSDQLFSVTLSWAAKLKNIYEENLWGLLTGFVVYVFFMFTTAYIYLKYRSEKTEMRRNPFIEAGPRRFDYGLFETDGCAGRDATICICSWICLGIRWADTMDKAKIIGFWTALVIPTICFGLNELTACITGFIFTVFAVYYRQVLRRQQGLDSGSLKSYIEDIVVWSVCCWCAAAQEARQVESVNPDC